MKKHPLILLVILLAVLLSGCTGGSRRLQFSSWPGVTVNAEAQTAYIADNMYVYSINLENGAELWRFPEKGNTNIAFFAAPALTTDGQVLVVASYDKVLYFLNAETGVELSSFKEAKDRYIASPLVTDQGIFVPNADGKLYALDPSGQKLWEFKTSKPLWSKPTADPSGEYIYLSGMDHYVYAINAKNGALKWQSADLGGAVADSPSLDAGVLYVGTFGSHIYALDANNGQPVWSAPYKASAWVWGSPAVVTDHLYFGDIDGNLYALQAKDGQETWRINASEKTGPQGPVVSTPLVISDTLYITSQDSSIYAYSLDKTQLWKQTVQSKLYAPAVQAGDLVLVAPVEVDQVLIAFAAEGGAQKWAFVPEVKK
jgi:outer membrane protein assembly factor BamB